MPLKYFRNVCRSFKILLINCKTELKLKWTKYCVLSAAGADNTNANTDDVTFTISDTNFLALSAKDNRNLSQRSNRFERSVYWNEYETKNENENTTNE